MKDAFGVEISKAMFHPSIPWQEVLHGTSSSASRKIMRRGFKPTTNANSKTMNAVHTTTDPKVAGEFADKATGKAQSPFFTQKRKSAGKPSQIRAIAVGSPLGEKGSHKTFRPAQVTPIKQEKPANVPVLPKYGKKR